MHENYAEAFWVVGFETFDHELYRAIVLSIKSVTYPMIHQSATYHVRHRKICHVENNGLK